MRLETVELLTRDRDLASRHIVFLTAERDRLKEKNDLSADEQLRLTGIETRLNDCKLYLAQLEPQLEKAIPELTQKIRQLKDEKFSLLLFERYICLKSIKIIAQELNLNINVAYAMHAQARDAYNELFDIPLYKDKRGRKKGKPSF